MKEDIVFYGTNKNLLDVKTFIIIVIILILLYLLSNINADKPPEINYVKVFAQFDDAAELCRERR